MRNIILYTLLVFSISLNFFTLQTDANVNQNNLAFYTPPIPVFPQIVKVDYKPVEFKLVKVIYANYKVPKPLASEIVNTVYKYTDDSFPQPELVFAIIATESSFNHEAVSHMGAIGLMQIMEVYHGPADDMKTNIRKGIKVLKDYRTQTKTDEEALEAYNIGIGNFLNNKKRNPGYVRDVLRYKTEFGKVMV